MSEVIYSLKPTYVVVNQDGKLFCPGRSTDGRLFTNSLNKAGKHSTVEGAEFSAEQVPNGHTTTICEVVFEPYEV